MFEAFLSSQYDAIADCLGSGLQPRSAQLDSGSHLHTDRVEPSRSAAMKIADMWVNLHLVRHLRLSEDRKVFYVTWVADATGSVPPSTPIVGGRCCRGYNFARR